MRADVADCCAPAQCVDNEKTLERSISLSGVGLHTGAKVKVEILPAEEGTGILFQRVDLFGCPTVPAQASFARGMGRYTALSCEGVEVWTPEHLMAVFGGLGITNAIVRLDAPEVPIFDGSARVYLEAVDRVGVCRQGVEVKPLVLKESQSVNLGTACMVALPSDEFRVSFTLHYPQSQALGTQYFSLTVTPESFVHQLASARTFCLYEDVAPLLEKGLIQGGSLDSALVFHGDKVLGNEGLRYPEEPVRHKILDVIGDLALVGKPLRAHVVSLMGGHGSNVELAKKIAQHESGEKAQ